MDFLKCIFYQNRSSVSGMKCWNKERKEWSPEPAGFPWPWPGHCLPGTRRYNSSTPLETVHIHILPSLRTHTMSRLSHCSSAINPNPNISAPLQSPLAQKLQIMESSIAWLCLIKAHQGGLLSERLWRMVQYTWPSCSDLAILVFSLGPFSICKGQVTAMNGKGPEKPHKGGSTSASRKEMWGQCRGKGAGGELAMQNGKPYF